MTSAKREKMRKWVENWKETGKVLREIEIEEYRRSNIGETILSLSDASEAALLAHPPKPSSGLIEMQRIFSKKTRKSNLS